MGALAPSAQSLGTESWNQLTLEQIEQLKDLLRYDPDSGLFWRSRSTANRTEVRGRPAGHTNAAGYVSIHVIGMRLMAHRIAWAISYNAWPLLIIDHINGMRADNRLVNLRVATKSQNGINSAPLDHTSKYTGVCWNPQRRKWVAYIRVSRKHTILGSFDDEETANAARKAAEKIHYGEFARQR